ncbi:unnamed protein product, partial [marine sediment metagenome]
TLENEGINPKQPIIDNKRVNNDYFEAEEEEEEDNSHISELSDTNIEELEQEGPLQAQGIETGIEHP